VGTGSWLDSDDRPACEYPATHVLGSGGWCVVVVGSRPAVGADLNPSGSSCGVEKSLASPTLVVLSWLEASCGRGQPEEEASRPWCWVLHAGPGRPRQSTVLPVLLQLGGGRRN